MSGSTLLTQHERTDSRIEKLEKKNKKNTSSTDVLRIYLKFLHVGHLRVAAWMAKRLHALAELGTYEIYGVM